jgi:hypothetical protein
MTTPPPSKRRRRGRQDVPQEVLEQAREQARSELENSQALDIIADLYEKSLQIDEDMKVRIYLEARRGVVQASIAERLGVSTSVITKWKRQGEQAYQRRRQNPERPGEPEQNGGRGS